MIPNQRARSPMLRQVGGRRKVEPEVNWLLSFFHRLFGGTSVNITENQNHEAVLTAGAEARAGAQDAGAPATTEVPVVVLPVVSATPGLDAYRKLLDLHDDRDRRTAEVERLKAEISDLEAQKTKHQAAISALPTTAAQLRSQVMARLDAIVGAFAK